jgi:hypothetical protein
LPDAIAELRAVGLEAPSRLGLPATAGVVASARMSSAERRRWSMGRDALGSLTTRLALFAILLASLTAALIGTLSYTRARDALEAEAESRLALLSRDVAEHLHRELEDRVADTTNWSRLEIMRALVYRDVDKELAQFLRQIVGGRQVYRAIACTGSDGEVVSAAGDVPGLLPGPPAGTRSPSSRSDREATSARSLLEAPVPDPSIAGRRSDAPRAPRAATAARDDRRVRPPGRRASVVTVRTRDGNLVLATGTGDEEAPPPTCADAARSGRHRGPTARSWTSSRPNRPRSRSLASPAYVRLS